MLKSSRTNMRKTQNIVRALQVTLAALILTWPISAGTSPREVSAKSTDAEKSAERSVRLFNTHTNERIDIVYKRGDEYISGALAKLDYFLRDHNTNEVRHFDPRLYDILSDLTALVGHPGGEIDIVCGYRTPETNAALRAHTNGVAMHSLHIQ